ncbi:MAG: hypothetical protein HC911_17500, partial [Chloroflexaceae bacterium]|nr:hypothetical protein [Chloroflexaceae bacterium]
VGVGRGADVTVGAEKTGGRAGRFGSLQGRQVKACAATEPPEYKQQA